MRSLSEVEQYFRHKEREHWVDDATSIVMKEFSIGREELLRMPVPYFFHLLGFLEKQQKQLEQQQKKNR